MGFKKKKKLISLFSTHKMSGTVKIRMMVISVKFLEQEHNYLKGAYLSSCPQINTVSLSHFLEAVFFSVQTCQIAYSSLINLR